MKKDEYGVYEIFLPNKADGTPAIEHNSKVKVRTLGGNGKQQWLLNEPQMVNLY